MSSLAKRHHFVTSYFQGYSKSNCVKRIIFLSVYSINYLCRGRHEHERKRERQRTMRHFIIIIVKYDYKGSKLPSLKEGEKDSWQEVSEMWWNLNVKAHGKSSPVRNKNRAFLRTLFTMFTIVISWKNTDKRQYFDFSDWLSKEGRDEYRLHCCKRQNYKRRWGAYYAFVF